MTPAPPPEYSTCLGDLYSVSWMENVDSINPKTETLNQQVCIYYYFIFIFINLIIKIKIKFGKSFEFNRSMISWRTALPRAAPSPRAGTKIK